MKFVNAWLVRSAVVAISALVMSVVVAGGALFYGAIDNQPVAAQETGAGVAYMELPMHRYVPAVELAPYDPANDRSIAGAGVGSIVNAGDAGATTLRHLRRVLVVL